MGGLTVGRAAFCRPTSQKPRNGLPKREGRGGKAAMSNKAEREARQARALRENLIRRKTQSRARDAEVAPIAEASPAPPHPEKTPDTA